MKENQDYVRVLYCKSYKGTVTHIFISRYFHNPNEYSSTSHTRRRLTRVDYPREQLVNYFEQMIESGTLVKSRITSGHKHHTSYIKGSQDSYERDAWDWERINK